MNWKKSTLGTVLAYTLFAAVALGGFYRSETNNRRLAQAQRDFETGRRYYEAGDLQHALAEFNLAIRVNGRSYLAYSYRALLFPDVGEYDPALDDVNVAIRLNPKWPVAFRVKGDVESALKQYEPAIEGYTSAIRINSPDPRGISNVVLAYQGRARAHLKLREFEAANQDEAKAHALLPQGKTKPMAQGLAGN